MTLSEELSWRGFVNQSTLESISKLDTQKYTFYWGVDPSSDSMTIGNLAMAMMIKHFINYGHTPILLVGGATGMIGDPDGKTQERNLVNVDEVKHNKQSIAKQYKVLFSSKNIKIVDNYDWFKDFRYLDFLRAVGKHVPMRQMLAREFVESRLGEKGNGISYAEFSYVLIQAYDFLYLHREFGVNMQVCGSDQWGNSIAGVDLIRRITSSRVDVWAGPLIVNPVSGVKFGKSEDGAIWLDRNKTSPMDFYQFWVNSEDGAVRDYLKIYTMLDKESIEDLLVKHQKNPKLRIAQSALADHVTSLVHGEQLMEEAKEITLYLTGKLSIGTIDHRRLGSLKQLLTVVKSDVKGSIVQALVMSNLATSHTNGRQLVKDGAIYINNLKNTRETFRPEDFLNGRLLIRRGKAYKDVALIEIQTH
jgi:tyrosyl-tRNA synthetase